MSRIAYVSGRYLPHRLATVHVEDRGYQFADGVYEVIAVLGGVLIDEMAHLERLTRSLGALRIEPPVSGNALRHILRRMVKVNGIRDGIVYLQITRGVARRDHAFPHAAQPQLVLTARRAVRADPQVLEKGVSVITVPEQRWARRDIKSVSLLPNVLAKQLAREAGAYEAWQVETDGTVTEGTSSNAWIVTRNGAIVTRPADHSILNGVTRLALIQAAAELGLEIEDRAFTLGEAFEATEAFITSSTTTALPVTVIDARKIGDGTPGPVFRALRTALERRIADQVKAGS
jgi:D-alanine transaminase